MKLKQLLLGALLAGASTMSAATFNWTPAGVQPTGETSITQIEGFYGVASNVSFYCWSPAGVQMTDVMPMWVDEDGNEIVATEGDKDFLDPRFSYYFNPNDFQMNGEYELVFPEGMLVTADGDKSAEVTLYYTFEVEALNSSMFPDFEVLDITPDFSKPQALWNQQEIIINTNHNAAIGFVNLVVMDLNPENPDEAYVITGTTNYAMHRQMGDASPITWTVENPGAPYKFYEGHDYRAIFTLYNGVAERTEDGVPTPIVERLTYTFTGLIEPYKYSDLVLESYTPEAGTVLNETSECIFTYTFSGPVDLYKITIPNGPAGEISVPKTYISCNEEKTVYTVDLRKDFSVFESAEGYVYLNIYAKDEDGRALVYYLNDEGELSRGMGYDDGAHFQFGWFNAIPLPKLVITPEYGAQINELTEVRVKFENGETFSSNAFYGVIQTKTGSIMGYLVEPENSIDVKELVITQWKKSLFGQPEPINLTAPGSYAVGFNEGSFIQGEEMQAKVSAPKFNAFTITGSASDRRDTLVPVMTTPANYSVLDELEYVTLYFEETTELLSFEASVINQKGEKVANVSLETNWDESEDGNVIDAILEETITTPGKYFLVIPEMTIANLAYTYSQGEEGIYNPYLSYEFDVTGGISADAVEMIGSDPEEGVVAELSKIAVTFNMPVDYNYMMDGVQLLDEDGEFLAYFATDYDYDNYNVLFFTLAEPITESGRYFVMIPEGYIVCNDDWNISNEYDIYLSYSILETGAEMVKATSTSTVYDLQGRVVMRNASADQISKLQKGVYVIDGKKVVK